MKEHIEQITHLAEVMYNETKGRYTITHFTAEDLQFILDEMQEELDKIQNELLRWEREEC